MYLCPISRSLMHDPVVIVETGQVYDHSSISKWFETGHKTCPLTGVALTSQSVVPLPSLSNCISDWASNHGLKIESHEKQLLKQENGTLKDLDNPCRSASLVSSIRVSVYDAEGVVALLKQTEQSIAVKYAALVVLRELALHSNERIFKTQILSEDDDINVIKQYLDHEDLQVNKACKEWVKCGGFFRCLLLVYCCRLREL